MFYFRFIDKSDVWRFIFLRIFLVAEFAFISFILQYNIKNIFFKKVIRIIPFLFTAYSLYNYSNTQQGQFDYKPLAAECLILLIYIIFFFYEKIQIITSVPIYQSKIFWIAVAFIIYCAGNFFLFLYSNNAIKNEEFGFYFTVIYSTCAIFKNIALCVGILIHQPEDGDKNPDLLTQASFLDNIKFKEST